MLLFLGWEDPLEEGMGTHSITLVRIIPWTEESDEPQARESQRARHDLLTFYTHAITEADRSKL